MSDCDNKHRSCHVLSEYYLPDTSCTLLPMPPKHLWNMATSWSPFIDGETEARRGYGNGFGSHSPPRAIPGLEPRSVRGPRRFCCRRCSGPFLVTIRPCRGLPCSFPLGGVSLARLSIEHPVESDGCPVWLDTGHTLAVHLPGLGTLIGCFYIDTANPTVGERMAQLSPQVGLRDLGYVHPDLA